MFKTTDKISKAIDLMVKATEELENSKRKAQAINTIHEMTKLQQDCFSDLKMP